MTLEHPRFSVVVLPSGAEPTDRVSATVASVRAQSCTDWELIILAHSREPVGALGTLVTPDPRIRSVEVSGPELQDAGLNQAVDAARGEFFLVLEPGDTLATSALTRLARAVERDPSTDLLYTDEDAPAVDGGRARDTVLLPDWSPELLRQLDYIGRTGVLRTSLIREVGGYRPELGNARDYDLTLRVSERARQIRHLPTVLRSSASRRLDSAEHDTAPGIRAAQDQLDRLGIAATAGPGRVQGYRRLNRELDPNLLVSIIIPTRGQSGSVDGQSRCYVVEAVRSALAKTAHENVEVVVVYDEPTPPEVLDQLHEIAGDRLVTIRYDKPFSFSEKCNLGFLRAAGDVLVLLNDDTEAISDGWLEELVAPLAEPDVGMTGAKLLYPDGTIQHGGHLYACESPWPWPIHAYRWCADLPGQFGGMGDLVVNRECSGVTAACVALRRDTYERVGGLTETLPGSFNDVDLSLKVRHAGLRILWLADCALYHFESQTRIPKALPFERGVLITRWTNSFQRDAYLPWLDFKKSRKRPTP